MKNKMKHALKSELNSIQVSSSLKQRILAEAAASRAPSRRKNGFSVRPLAIAAAVMVTFCLAAGLISLRAEKPDLSTTPLAAVQSKQESVWIGDDGLYHGASICGDQQNMQKMTPERARAEGRKACSACIEPGSPIAENLVWITTFGRYYHEDTHCSGMEGAIGVLEIEAETLGLSACPVCAGGELATLSPMPIITACPTPAADSEQVVQNSPTVAPTLSPKPWYGITRIESRPVFVPDPTAEPEQRAQPTPAATPEPTPMPTDAEISVWMTDGGIYCHAEEHCSGMNGAKSVAIKQALLSGKNLCPTCMERTIWIDEATQQWHLAKNCSGLDHEMQILQPGEQPELEGCPVCAAGGIPVWTAEKDIFYHWDEFCSGMPNSLQIMESEALDGGKQACPLCMTVELGGVSAVFATKPEPEELYVWMTEHGVFYHSNEHCSGMNNAKQVAGSEAIQSGKMRCPNCMNNTVWIHDDNVYYHAAAARYCSGMMDAVSIAEQEALDINKKPCPSCIGETVENESSSEDINDNVWVTDIDSLYYHTDAYCASMFTAAEARVMGKAACAVCAENVSDNASVWLNGDKHFHLDKKCSELPAAMPCSVDEAIQSGRAPCVLCAKQPTFVDAASVE